MRITKEFAKRKQTRVSEEPIRKYFLVFEGDETEVRYFQGVSDNRAYIGINPLIEIKTLLRSYNEKGWSNPKKILDRVIKYVEESKTGGLTAQSLIQKVVNYLAEDNVISSSTIYTLNDIEKILFQKVIYSNNLKKEDIITDLGDIVDKICTFLSDEMKISKQINDILGYIDSQSIVLDEEFDKICLVVDRDKESFVSLSHNDQYDYVRKTCEEKGYKFYLSNPCFEFWLLLHFDEIHSINQQKLLKNEKVSRNKRFVEDELRKLLQGYHKNDIKFDILKDKIGTAIKNEKSFCEDIIPLKDQLGSNIGLLLTELREETSDIG